MGARGMGRVACVAVVAAVAPWVRPAAAGSVAATTLTLPALVARSARVVEGKVLSATPFVFEGTTFFSLEVAVNKALRGSPGRPGEIIRVFDPGQWFAHTHAAAIRGGVISYEDPRYATPVAAAELKKGAVLLFFLGSEAAPPGFPTGTAFLTCGQAYDRAARAADVLALAPATFDAPFTLKVGGRAVLPDGLEVELKAHAHKRPLVGGPSKEMSELQLTLGRRSELVTIGHVVFIQKDGAPPNETWEAHDWDRYRLELVQMKYDDETTLRVRRKAP